MSPQLREFAACVLKEEAISSNDARASDSFAAADRISNSAMYLVSEIRLESSST